MTMDTVAWMADQSVVFSFDNMQRFCIPSMAGLWRKATCRVVVSTILRALEDSHLQSTSKEGGHDFLHPTSCPLQLSPNDIAAILLVMDMDFQLHSFHSGGKVSQKRVRDMSRAEATLRAVEVLPVEDRNPSCRTDIIELLDLYLRLISLAGKKWIFLVCDGRPYKEIRTVQEQNPGKYDQIHLIIGGLHEGMNYLKGICKILDSFGLLTPACAMMNARQKSFSNF